MKALDKPTNTIESDVDPYGATWLNKSKGVVAARSDCGGEGKYRKAGQPPLRTSYSQDGSTIYMSWAPLPNLEYRMMTSLVPQDMNEFLHKPEDARILRHCLMRVNTMTPYRTATPFPCGYYHTEAGVWVTQRQMQTTLGYECPGLVGEEAHGQTLFAYRCMLNALFSWSVGADRSNHKRLQKEVTFLMNVINQGDFWYSSKAELEIGRTE